MKRKSYVGVVLHVVLATVLGTFIAACSSDTDYADVHEIAVVTQPSAAAVGEVQTVAFRLVNDVNSPFKVPGVTVEIRLNKNKFADGDSVKSATTDGEGIARFEFSIDKASTGYVLIATSDHDALEGVSVTTLPFDIEADEPANIAVVNHPSTSKAGAPMNASFRLVYPSNRPFKRAGVEVEIRLNKNDFGNGDSVKSATTDDEGIAHFEFSVDKVSTGYALLATSSHDALEGVTTNTLYFDITAGPVSPETSSISGTNGVTNDEEGAQITIHLFDAYGNPVSGVTPTFGASGVGNTPKACSKSDSSGTSTCAMTSTTAGLKSLHISTPVAVDGETIEFVWDCNEAGTPFGGGDGSVENPYRLCAPEHLIAVGTTPLYLWKAFVVVENINMSGVDDFTPVGGLFSSPNQRTFKGRFDGGHKRIQRLQINGGVGVGLFANIEASGRVENVHLVDVVVRGDSTVGGLAGVNKGTIIASMSSGSVKGTASTIGGLVGENHGTIEASYSVADVEGEVSRIGGLVGGNYGNGVVSASYSTGSVTGNAAIGGLVGYHFKGMISASYSSSSVSGTNNVGGLIGQNGTEGAVEASYWDIETSGQVTTAGDLGEGMDTEGFAEENTFTAAGWDFVDTWTMGTAPDGETRPILQWQAE